ncbi:hypothetical protein SeLEV6574_g08483, partial [Synchytrium endobioticum]
LARAKVKKIWEHVHTIDTKSPVQDRILSKPFHCQVTHLLHKAWRDLALVEDGIEQGLRLLRDEDKGLKWTKKAQFGSDIRSVHQQVAASMKAENSSAQQRARTSATARNKSHMFKFTSIIYQTHKTPGADNTKEASRFCNTRDQLWRSWFSPAAVRGVQMYKDVQDKPYKDADLYHRRVFDYVMYTNLGSVSWMTVYPGRPFGKPQQPSPLVPGDYRFNRRYTRIVAVDPGINNGVDYDDKDDAMKEMPAIREISLKEWLNQAQLPAKEKGRRLKQLDQSWTYSNDQWKEKTGINLHHRLNQVRLLKHPHVQQVMADIPSACTSQYQDYIHRPQYLVLHLEVLVDYHDKARSSRWDRYKRKQRALHEICMRIRGSGTKDDTVVIWGNGNFTSLGRKQGAPTKTLRRRRIYANHYL